MIKTILLDALLQSGDITFDGMKYLQKVDSPIDGSTHWMLLGFKGEEVNIERSMKRRLMTIN